jgi:hypothetical protein
MEVIDPIASRRIEPLSERKQTSQQNPNTGSDETLLN